MNRMTAINDRPMKLLFPLGAVVVGCEEDLFILFFQTLLALGHMIQIHQKYQEALGWEGRAKEERAGGGTQLAIKGVDRF